MLLTPLDTLTRDFSAFINTWIVLAPILGQQMLLPATAAPREPCWCQRSYVTCCQCRNCLLDSTQRASISHPAGFSHQHGRARLL